MKKIVCVVAALTLLLGAQSRAALITVSLGEKDFDDGDFLLVGGPAGYNAAQVGEDNPFGKGLTGGDGPFGPSFSESWIFSYTPGTVSSASITLGLWEHDSAASGDQVDSFTIDGIDFTAELNGALNAAGGGSNQPVIPGPFHSEYNVYSIGLSGASVLAALGDGSATAALTLKNGSTPLGVFAHNGAGIDFSNLSIDIESAGNVIPEPSSFAIFGVLSVLIVGWGWQRKRKA